MSRDESPYLEDIKECCEKVLKFTKGMNFKDFVHDDLHYDAVLLNLEVIGEAIKHISAKRQKNYPQVKWRKIAGFRDIVAYNYFGVSDEIVWDIVENEIPALLKQINTMLNEK